MIKSGKFAAQFINDGELENEQVQPIGIDLTIGGVMSAEPGKMPGFMTSSEKWMQYWHDVEPSMLEFPDGEMREGFVFNPNKVYKVVYDEVIGIPEGHAAFVYPRSTFMRLGGMVNTAIWDPGYRGRGVGRVTTDYRICVEDGARIAQITMMDVSDLDEKYDGSYQDERLDEGGDE